MSYKKTLAYPLSQAQKRMWVLYKLLPDSPFYNIWCVKKIFDSIDVTILESSLLALVNRHESLRTNFLEIKGKPFQIVRQIDEVRTKKILKVIETRNTQHETLIKDITQTPFKLEFDPLYRFTLIKTAASKYIFTIVLHHIISDGWSVNIFWRELAVISNALAKDKVPVLSKLPVQYKDYAAWEQSKENQKRLDKQKQYWFDRLGENPPVTGLPLDYPRSSILEYRKGYTCDYLDIKTIDRLRKIANSHNASLFMVFFAIANLYIARLTGKDDVITGISVAHRDNPDLVDLIGYFSNDIPVRTKLNENSTFEKLLEQVKENILHDHQNGEYPLEKLINDLSSTRDIRNIRLFNSICKINENNKDRLCPGNIFDNENLHSGRMNNQAPDNDWGVIFEIYKDKTRLSSEYNANVLKAETIQSWTNDLAHLIRQIAEDPEKHINDYEAVSPAAREKLLNKFNKTDKKQHPTKAPHHYFEAQAKKTPADIAAVYQNQKISYQKLNEEANRFANCLIDKGIKKGDAVAVDIGEELYLNIPKIVLGIHKAGAACLFIDREHPEERIGYILKQSKAKAIISDSSPDSYIVKTKNKKPGLAKIDITEPLDKYSPKPPKRKGIEGTDTAFIVFTSGTTGAPKGIKATARGMVNEAYYKVDQLGIKDITAVPQNFSLAHITSQEFICTSFVLGKKLLIYPKTELYDAYAVMQRTEREKVKFMWTTPSVLNSYLGTIEAGNKDKIPLRNLALLCLTGEKTYPELARRFYSLYEHITLASNYGGSEVLTCVNVNISNEKDLLTIKDGKATRNQQVYILDKDRKLLPIGAIGEIYCSGHGLANGYLEDPSLTKERFLPHPFVKGERIYRTGDLGRIDNEGNIEVKGRIGNRVKIRGQRVELDEIREKIKRMAGIGEVLIRAREKRKDYELELACYYTVKAGSIVTAREIQAVLKREVPQFMIPAYFVELEAFPLNQSGKIDKAGLPEPTEEHFPKTEYVEPETSAEKKLADIWCEVLKVEIISRYDNFFDLGGHSLRAISVLARINQEFNIDLGLKVIFQYPQLKEQAEKLDQETNRKNRAVAIKIPRAPKKKYYQLSYAQERMFIHNILDPKSHLFNVNVILRPKESIDTMQFERAVAFMASRHAVLRTKFKEVNGRPVQIVCDKSIVKLQIQTLASSGNQEKDNAQKEAALEKIIRAPFDLAREAPFRVVLLRSQDTGANSGSRAGDILAVSAHHIAADQWSMRILLKELFDIYQAYSHNKKPDLPKLNIQYKDYAEWEQSRESQKRLVKQRQYWLSRLSESPPVTGLPLDYPRESVLEYEKGYICDYLDDKTIERLRQIANDHNASLFMVLFAVANLYVARLTGKDDVITGTSIAHRDNPDLANMIGYLGNDIPVRTRLTDKETFSALLIQTRENILSDYQNGEYPLEKLIDDLSSTRDVRNIRLFNALFKINENNKERPCPKDIFNNTDLYDGKINNQATNNDWGVIFEIYKDKARISNEYNASILKEETIRSWVSDLIYLIKQVADNPDKKIKDYEAVSPAIRGKLLNKFNKTDKKQHPTKAPHHYFEAQAKKTPHKIAAVYEDKTISYRKLNDEANRLANCLVNKGIKKGGTVAVDIGEELYLNIPKIVLGVHKAGAACVFLDREYPRERIRYILEKSKVKVIIRDNSAQRFPVEKSIVKIDITAKLDEYSSKPPKQKGIEGTDTAFIVFTSGTTGVPKGIKATARGMVNEAYNKVDQLKVDDITAIPQNFSLAYIPSLEFICVSFVLGKKLVIYPKTELYDTYAVMKRTDEQKIKFITLTPSALNSYSQMVEDDSNNRDKIPLKNLKLIDLIGEKIYPQLARRFYSLYEHITLTSDYGCSEVLTCANGNIPNKKDLLTIKDGKATRNQKVYILDKNRKLLPIGATGEIYCSGYGLANGYIGDEKQTRERFLPHPFVKGGRIYRTGDRGRIDLEGNIEVKGRIDDQVKIRGQRVELDEIREKIKRMAGIGEVLIRAREKGKDYELELACYYTVKAGSIITAREIQAALKREVPQFMIPAYYVELEAFPLNQSGKIDKAGLPEPTEEHFPKTEYVEPETVAEKKIAGIWREVLSVEKISRYDNFFDLGGHSLRAIQVLVKARKDLNIQITLRDVFEHPTLAAIAEIIENSIVEKILKNN